jgi:hypothetical protein
MQNSEQPQMSDMLVTVTDTLLAGKNVDSVLNAYGVTRKQVASYLSLIVGLKKALVSVQPSRRFSHRLKQDLMGAPRMNVITRIRYLPPRVQIAAGVALMAGFLLLLRRRASGGSPMEVIREMEASV